MRNEGMYRLFWGVVFIVCLGVLAIWEFSVCNPEAVRWFDSDESCTSTTFSLLSRPSAIVSYIISGDYGVDLLINKSLMTITSTLAAIIISVLLTAVAGVTGIFVRPIWDLSYRILWFLQIVPLIVIGWMLQLAFGDFDKIAFGVVVGAFPLLNSVIVSAKHLPLPLQEILQLHQSSRWVAVKHLLLPYCVRRFFGSLNACAALAMVGVMICELNGGENAGLGQAIWRATRAENSNETAMYTLAAIAISLGFFGICSLAERLAANFMPWYPHIES